MLYINKRACSILFSLKYIAQYEVIRTNMLCKFSPKYSQFYNDTNIRLMANSANYSRYVWDTQEKLIVQHLFPF